ncbi:MAG TPA: OsmC family protein [Haliangiales bacterium]|nr:OsmC family protein [Haliangiales bacterium]
MAEYFANVTWRRGDDPFLGQRYHRRHTWRFDGGAEVPASASPHVVRAPWSAPDAVDPEEAFVASLSSCHMLFFLSFAARAGFVVDAYEDDAVGVVGKTAAGKEAVVSVTLKPRVTWRDRAPSADELAALHHEAHEHCYIANSVTTDVRVAPR